MDIKNMKYDDKCELINYETISLNIEERNALAKYLGLPLPYPPKSNKTKWEKFIGLFKKNKKEQKT